MNTTFDIIIVGGGAAGFFTALNTAEKNKNLKIAILERGKEVLQKVRISGGGRCNVTHACFEPNLLVKNYPRGEKELRSPFEKFDTRNTIEWFKNKGIQLKTEADGRMFPTSNTSETIIDCFLKEAKFYNISILTNQSVQNIEPKNEGWLVQTNTTVFKANKLVMATGSNTKIWDLLTQKGHSIIAPVPSLFTFNIQDSRIKNLMGISTQATVSIPTTKLIEKGPVLITHWGLSGPAILRLSAWGALALYQKNYEFILEVNWLENYNQEQVKQEFLMLKQSHAKKNIIKHSCFNLPNRLWESFCLAAQINHETKWADCSKIQMQNLGLQLTKAQFKVHGKSTFKDEFVTAGGVHLKEINFKTMQSKLFENLYFAGEIMNIDAITGGFNFQNAWTSSFLVAEALS